MAYQLDRSSAGVSGELIELLLGEHERVTKPRLAMLWSYFRNPLEMGGQVSGLSGSAFTARLWSGKGYRLAQERGLPGRLTGQRGAGLDDRSAWRREVVIENDIGWRLSAMVDFLFGKPVTLKSTAKDPATAAKIERALAEAWEASGGQTLMQDLALLGHVYGYVDLAVRWTGAPRSLQLDETPGGEVDTLASLGPAPLKVEIVEPTRGVPVVSGDDYRTLDAYVVRAHRHTGEVRETGGFWGRGRRSERGSVIVTEVLTPALRQVYEDRGGGPMLVHGEANTILPGEVPVVHIQNVSQPFTYAGLSEVEPLIPLQDELNTRLSDRASRVTMQSFKMYLAKGIEGFDKTPVGPGQYWVTDNMDASIESFGGDAASPSEETHIGEIREAMDKISAVPPLATGVVKAKIGNLTSERALRLTLQGLLVRTQRKRITYGRGIAEASRLLLAALDGAGLLRTRADERGVIVEWPDPLAGIDREVSVPGDASASPSGVIGHSDNTGSKA